MNGFTREELETWRRVQASMQQRQQRQLPQQPQLPQQQERPRPMVAAGQRLDVRQIILLDAILIMIYGVAAPIWLPTWLGLLGYLGGMLLVVGVATMLALRLMPRGGRNVR